MHSSGQAPLPQRLARLGITDRRRAFGRRSDPLEVVFREREIVRTGLGGDRHALPPRRVHLCQSVGAAYLDDRRTSPLPSPHADEEPAQRVHFRRRRPPGAPPERTPPPPPPP